MSDKLYLITEAQRKNYLQIMHNNMEDPDAYVAIAVLQSLPMVDSEPVGWHTEDHLTNRSATTYKKSMMHKWVYKGWPVTPIYTSPQALTPQSFDEWQRSAHMTRFQRFIDQDYVLKAEAITPADASHHWAMGRYDESVLPAKRAFELGFIRARQLHPQAPQALTPITPEDDGSDWFYKLQFICRVLQGISPDKTDMQTALGMAQSLRRDRWKTEKAMQPLTPDDVTDEMLKILDTNTHPSSTRAEIMAAAYNVVIKDRSEAK